MTIATGIREETAELECKVTFFTKSTTAVKDYDVTLRIDLRDMPFYESITQAVSRWEEDWGLKPAPIPQAATVPMITTPMDTCIRERKR